MEGKRSLQQSTQLKDRREGQGSNAWMGNLSRCFPRWKDFCRWNMRICCRGWKEERREKWQRMLSYPQRKDESPQQQRRQTEKDRQRLGRQEQILMDQLLNLFLLLLSCRFCYNCVSRHLLAVGMGKTPPKRKRHDEMMARSLLPLSSSESTSVFPSPFCLHAWRRCRMSPCDPLNIKFRLLFQEHPSLSLDPIFQTD